MKREDIVRLNILTYMRLTIFALVIVFFPKPFASAQACNADSLLGTMVGEYCTSTTGAAVGCPSSNYACCPYRYEVSALGRYTNILHAYCAPTAWVYEGIATNNLLSGWGWLNETNGVWGPDTALAPYCSTGDASEVPPPGPGGTVAPNYNLCPAGYKMMGRQINSLFPDYIYICAYSPDGACCVDSGNSCNNTPPPPDGSTDRQTACCSNVTGADPAEQCIYPNGIAPGTCGQCAGGTNPSPVSDPPVPCRVDAGVLCCSSGITAVSCEDDIFQNNRVLPNGALTTSACMAAPLANQCGGKAANGSLCWLDSQCGSGNCDFASDGIKRCIGTPTGGACSGADSTCECANSTDVCLDPEADGSFNCLDPTQLCQQPTQACNGAAADPDAECCDNLFTGEEYSCHPALNICTPTGSCISPGVGCSPLNTAVDCCDSGLDYVCNAPVGSPTGVCERADTCNAVLNQTACNGPQDCCPTTHPDWTCSTTNPRVCITNNVGLQCTGTGCCDGINGYVCQAGFCIMDPTGACNTDIQVVPYTGPIIEFHDLISRIYGLLFPIGILIGVAFIIKAGYTLMTSEGNPQKVKEGQEELTAAIIGTFFILLSVAILRVIISSVLNVPVGF
ncbi:hypothetical protein A2415_02800 [candidate division WWE3 bacterium RIFOXYC1_FULL_39_7]|uniref:Uncharacterized protein n=2 Tax=Katanobacteria TaxID=422282 RepID=A0A1F4X4M7_UNCKA|nr:MAG: hypothetical protein A2415_02800 [candidate division WWE3 bacterium RIFOXYC1_FULL_39_7]OGC76625.1 MAG: hypothetical protein A2619_04190 [candidate division WWE3 bacterium RIFOXYD1_FULL_39_9]